MQKWYRRSTYKSKISLCAYSVYAYSQKRERNDGGGGLMVFWLKRESIKLRNYNALWNQFKWNKCSLKIVVVFVFVYVHVACVHMNCIVMMYEWTNVSYYYCCCVAYQPFSIGKITSTDVCSIVPRRTDSKHWNKNTVWNKQSEIVFGHMCEANWICWSRDSTLYTYTSYIKSWLNADKFQIVIFGITKKVCWRFPLIHIKHWHNDFFTATSSHLPLLSSIQ